MTIGFVEKSFTGTGSTDSIAIEGEFNVSVDFSTGSGVGTVVLKRSYDKGSSFKPKAIETYQADDERVGDSPEPITYKLECTVFTSGIIAVRISY